MKLVKVKMLASAVTSKYSLPKGREITLPENIANDLIRGGIAVKVEEKRVGRPSKNRETR